jgi:ElaB/YqjD/DUF883 family membrane-anchored ribosome-binding protein
MDEVKSMSQLVTDAEELLEKLRNSASPEIRQLRDKVESSIGQMKVTIADDAKASADRLREATKSVVEYVQQNPWVAVAAGTAIAVALIYVAFAGRSEREA